jgi:hypothetical protein
MAKVEHLKAAMFVTLLLTKSHMQTGFTMRRFVGSQDGSVCGERRCSSPPIQDAGQE